MIHDNDDDHYSLYITVGHELQLQQQQQQQQQWSLTSE